MMNNNNEFVSCLGRYEPPSPYIRELHAPVMPNIFRLVKRLKLYATFPRVNLGKMSPGFAAFINNCSFEARSRCHKQFFKCANPGLFFVYFRSFQTNNTILHQINAS